MYATTPLINAIKRNRYEAVALLLEHGANPNISTRSYLWSTHLTSSINHAIDFNCDISIISLLLDYGATVDLHVLSSVVHKGSTDVLRMMIEKGVDMNPRHNIYLDRTIVSVAYKASKIDMLKLLLENGSYPIVERDDYKMQYKEEMDELINKYKRSRHFDMIDEDTC
jgi:ankyrin repeat protein